MKSLTGVIQGGVVVLDQAAAKPEGTRVIVQVPESNWIDEIAGAWKDDEASSSGLVSGSRHAQCQKARRSDVRA